jgi:spore coat protein A, manganese oxidase
VNGSRRSACIDDEKEMYMSRTKQKFAVVATVLAATAAAAPLPGGTLSPVGVPKYTEQLVIPPTFAAGTTTTPTGLAAQSFALSVRPLMQQVLPTVNAAGQPLAMTPVWGYGSATQPSNWPAFTIEARQGTPTFVTWRNRLVDGAGNFVPHLFTIDQTLHWANPAATNCVVDPAHLHGGHIEAPPPPPWPARC